MYAKEYFIEQARSRKAIAEFQVVEERSLIVSTLFFVNENAALEIARDRAAAKTPKIVRKGDYARDIDRVEKAAQEMIDAARQTIYDISLCKPANDGDKAPHGIFVSLFIDIKAYFLTRDALKRGDESLFNRYMNSTKLFSLSLKNKLADLYVGNDITMRAVDADIASLLTNSNTPGEL